jgi:hypothetical protein
MEQTCAVCPLVLQTATNLALGLLEMDPPRADATALRALQRADAAGPDFQAARLLQAAANAVAAGAQGGPTFRLARVRPLSERARHRLDASRSYMPLALWRQVDAGLRAGEAGAAALAAEHGGDASPSLCVEPNASERLVEQRVCSTAACLR